MSKHCYLALAFLVITALQASEPVAKDSTESDPDIAIAFKLQNAFQKLAKRVAPCVVSLHASSAKRPFAETLKRLGDHIDPGLGERSSEGSGVVVDAGGLIITNEHVIRGADSIQVKFIDGRVYSAEVAGVDPRSDLAMLKLTDSELPKNLAVAELADSDKAQIGQYAMAVGNPFGLSNSFTLGVVSALGRNVVRRDTADEVFYGNLIQTDTPINPGNSGGPLFDLNGRLLGINTMIYSVSGYSQGCGFAIPSNHLKPRLAYLKSGCEIEYGWLGVQLENIEPLQKDFKIPDNKGVRVSRVLPDTPADRAGLAHGSIILDFDGTRVGNVDELKSAVNQTPVGRNVKVRLLDAAGSIAECTVRVSKRYAVVVSAQISRLGRALDSESLDLDEFEATVKAQSLSSDKPESKIPQEASKIKAYSWRGMQFKELPSADVKKKGGRIEVTYVKKGSPADRAGLYEGAVLAELKHAANPAILKLGSLDEFKNIVVKISGPVALYTPLDGYVTVEDK